MDNRPPVARLMGLPGGSAGTIHTVRIMKKLAKDAVRDPKQIIRNKALEIFRSFGVASRAFLPEAQALQRFVQRSIAYRRDPTDYELVQSPEVTLKLGAGDCDDQATLLGALLMTTGHPARFVAVGMDGNPFSHVLVETKVANEWRCAETILPKPFGWYPQNVTSRYELSL